MISPRGLVRRPVSPWPLALLAAAALLPAAAGGCKQKRRGKGSAAAATRPGYAARPGDLAVDGAGLRTPESVLHDEQADVYLVSSIAGSPLGKDDNGFISRVRPDGTVAELRWIDGKSDEVTLHAPKGMALLGDLLYVSDIDVVRRFDRKTGKPRGEVAIAGATFLNDLVALGDTIYVSDSGVQPGAGAPPSGAVHAIRGNTVTTVARGAELGRPNGLAVHGGALWVVTFGGTELYRLTPQGKREQITALPKGGLDGVVALADGTFLVSSWEANAVYAGRPGGTFTERFGGLRSPADLGLDRKRNRLLVPLFELDMLVARPLASAQQPARPPAQATPTAPR